MRRWPVNRSVRPVNATEVERVASSGGRPAASTEAVDRPAEQANRRQQRQQQEIRRLPFGQPKAEQRDAEHRGRRQGEVDAAGDHVISANGDDADRAETEDRQRYALDQHQADILPAEEVGRLHAQPHQQRQKQDQGNFQ